MLARFSPKTVRLTAWDATLAAGGWAALFLAGIIGSAKRPFWYDEVFTWTLVSDPSLRHMLWSIRHGVDAPAATYQFLARVWLALTVASPRALRILSGAGFGTGLAVAYLSLRRAFSCRAAAFGTLATLATSSLVLYYSSEARFYGWFFACTALAVAVWARTGEQRSIGPGLLALVVLSNAALAMSHVYGVVYSGALLVAAVAYDRWQGWFRPRLYLGIAASWLALLPWIGAFRSTADLSKPRGWMQPPPFNQLLDVYRFQSPRLPLLLLAAALLIGLQSLTAGKEGGTQRWSRIRPVALSALLLAAAGVLALSGPFLGLLDLALALGAILAFAWRGRADSGECHTGWLFAAAALLAVPAAAYAFSHLVRPLFMLRYLIPSTLGASILVTYITELGLRGAGEHASSRVLTAAWTALLAALLAWPVVSALQAGVEETPLYGVSAAAVERLAPLGVPIVAEDAISFVPLEFETRREGRPYYYLLDAAIGLSPLAPRGADTSHNHMQAVRAAGYFAGHILAADDFLREHDRFVVLHAPQFLWYQERLRDNPAYRCRKLGQAGRDEVVLVERNNPVPGNVAPRLKSAQP